MSKQPKKKEEKLTATSFENLQDSEKERIFAEIEAESPEQRLANSRPLTREEQADWDAFVRKANRARNGRIKEETVSIRVKQSLLKKADAYARRHNLNRSELFARGVQRLLGITGPTADHSK